MSNSTAPGAVSAAVPLPQRIGRPLDLLWLLLFGAGGLFFCQSVALAIFTASLRPSHTELSGQQLVRLAVRQAESNAFFLVPVQAVLYLLLAAFIYVRVTRVARSRFWPAVAWWPVGWPRAGWLVVAGGALALAIELGTALFPPPVPLPIEKLFTSRAAALLVFSAGLVLAPFFEELIFRGYLYGLFEPAWGVAPAVGVTGILFGLLHAPQLIPGWLQIGFLCLVGIAFSLARAQTGSLRASMLMHIAYNATITALFLASGDFAKLPPHAHLWLPH